MSPIESKAWKLFKIIKRVLTDDDYDEVNAFLDAEKIIFGKGEET
jgi:hypothetical protein